MRRDLFAWLESHLVLHMKMGLGSVPLLVSSDVIETLMGMLKQVIERMPTPEFSTLTLATPLFCGGQTEETRFCRSFRPRRKEVCICPLS